MSGHDHQHDHDHDHGHSTHGHNHGHSHGGGHSHAPANFDRAFAIGVALNGGFVVAQVVFGLTCAFHGPAGGDARSIISVTCWAC